LPFDPPAKSSPRTEELVRRFELRIGIAALGASATAITLARVFLGDAPDFHVDALAYASNKVTPLFFVLGVQSWRV
jgi:CIC family chloride channel protein